jgi:AcrR family transcriptional regulator
LVVGSIFVSPIDQTERPLRRDAERNRRRILEAAAAAFAERGLAATTDEIAARAEVGIGTVYRHFPDKELLIEALLEARLADLVARGEQALEADDPWQALIGFLEYALVLQAADRGLKDILLSSAHGSAGISRVRERFAPVGDRLVERAQQAGRMRPDVRGSDLPLVQMMIGATVDFTRPVEPDAWRRMLAIVIDGLRAREDLTALGAPALTPDQVDRAMREWKPARG